MTKHKPATPLPWAKRYNAAKEKVRRADAYPRLVEALREAVATLTKRGMPSQHDLLERARASNALLRELGEDA